MISLSLFVLALALSDLCCGRLTTDPSRLARAASAVACSSLLAGGIYVGLGATTLDAFVLSALAFAFAGSWVGFRAARLHRCALSALGMGLSIAIIGNPLLGTEADLTGVEAFLIQLPWYDGRATAELYVLAFSLLGFLGATGNAIVRSVLLIASDESALERSQSRLRGGRFIGVLERYLIFGLALAGEPTAAALIISAKSIIRFPELSARARPDESPSLNETDEITEYFLLGSLTSWAVALAPTVRLSASSG